MVKKVAYGTYEAAQICHVTPSTIGNWIEKDLIPTFTTGGGHRRIWAKDLLEFLKKHNMPVPEYLNESSAPKILVVDDDAHICSTVKRIVKKTIEGAIVDCADNGFDAGQKIADMQPVLVILDLRLPGIDGFKICASIRSNEKLKETKVLAISGHSEAKYRARALEAGANMFLPKPFELSDMKDALLKLLKGTNE
jgi:CheY-like chemotaxis protein